MDDRFVHYEGKILLCTEISKTCANFIGGQVNLNPAVHWVNLTFSLAASITS